ncbi:MAG: hypothetical protein P4L51_10875 [Puia sp.]|nr:hypothetical protein [Puia sp.]
MPGDNVYAYYLDPRKDPISSLFLLVLGFGKDAPTFPEDALYNMINKN